MTDKRIATMGEHVRIDGTTWPLPNNRIARVARYNPGRLTDAEAMTLAGIANAYDHLLTASTTTEMVKRLRQLRRRVKDSNDEK